MNRELDEQLDPELMEKLADVEHERWSGWMRYMFGKGTMNEDGTWTMPAWAVERWQQQAKTKYAELPEEQKASDREEVEKNWAVIVEHGA